MKNRSKVKERGSPEKKETNKTDNYEHLAFEILAPPRGLTAFLRRQKKQRKNCMLLWHVRRSPIGQN